MYCDNCDSERVISIMAKCSDMCSVIAPWLDVDHQGYAPKLKGICGGDYINIDICVECGVVTSNTDWPITNDEIMDSIEG
jgi:hypothetical protein